MIRALLFCPFLLLFVFRAQGEGLSTCLELPGGFVIGGFSGGKWLSSEQAGKTVVPGHPYSVYKLFGLGGRVTGGKAKANQDVCPDVWEQEVQPANEEKAIAVSASWNPMPRKAKLSDPKQEVYVKAARDFLISKGISEPTVKITQILRIDLDGDGEEEVLLTATNYLKDDGTVPSSAAAGNYSFVLLRSVVNGKVQTKLVEGDFYSKANENAAPNRYEVRGLLDLNGDGRLEIIVGSSYYEGGGASIWQFGAGKLKRVLEYGCGA
ncbi:MAG: hypothetical protein ABI992_04325 [Chthoniobacterales bacterium]